MTRASDALIALQRFTAFTLVGALIIALPILFAA